MTAEQRVIDVHADAAGECIRYLTSLAERGKPDVTRLIEHDGPIEWPDDPAAFLVWIYSERLQAAVRGVFDEAASEALKKSQGG